MAFIRALESYAAHRLGRLLGPLVRRRSNPLRRGAVDADVLRRARSAAWGGERRWYPGGTPPRPRNRVTPFVDGNAYFETLRAALAEARSYVYVIGWSLTPRMPLARQSHADLLSTQLLTLLDQAARRARVKVLLWGGAPLFLEPTSRMARAVQEEIQAGVHGDLECRLDHNAGWMQSLHQKTIVIDGQIAFVGGIDLTTLGGDRWDHPEHPLRAGPNWHDVQLRIEGEAVADVEENFRQRWSASGGGADLPRLEPRVEPDWNTPVQVIRTIPAGLYPFAPRGEFGIHYAYLHALRSAQRLIYLENQYLWAPDVVDVLIQQLERHRDQPYRIVLLLPAWAVDGKWDNDQHVNRLRRADAGRGRLSIYSLYASGPGIGVQPFTALPIYVHAKVALIDDTWVTAGSANLNGRGFTTDCELNVLVCDPDLARATRVALWSEHLGMSQEAVSEADPTALVDGEWATRSAFNAERLRLQDAPMLGAVCPYQAGGVPGDWLLEEFQALTF